MLGMGMVYGRFGSGLGPYFRLFVKGPLCGWRIETPDGQTNVRKNVIKNVIINAVEVIVHMPTTLAHPIEQAGGLQGRGTVFHGKFMPA
jgi:hypothetical protein